MLSKSADLYEDDFYAWTQRQARELRRFAATRPNLPLDLSHLAEEIADLGKEQRNSLRRWTTRIIEHLLLLGHSTATEPRPHWVREIIDFRGEIEDRLTGTLRPDLARQLPRLYANAARRLRRKLPTYEANASLNDLPAGCPYTLDQILEDWWPPGVVHPATIA
jgi:hypothetical protein